MGSSFSFRSLSIHSRVFHSTFIFLTSILITGCFDSNFPQFSFFPERFYPYVKSITPSTATHLGGTQITINSYDQDSDGFEEGVTVMMGGQFCRSVVRISKSTLSCTTPPGAPGYARLDIFNPSGRKSSSNYLFAYTPQLEITDIHPKRSQIHANQKITLEGSGFNYDSKVKLADTPLFCLTQGERIFAGSGGFYYSKLECRLPNTQRNRLEIPQQISIENSDGVSVIANDAFTYSRYDLNGYDLDGYNLAGRDRNGRDRQGRDAEGFDWEGYDREGFNRQGFNRRGLNREGFDRNGRQRNGFDQNGYNEGGMHRDGHFRQVRDAQERLNRPFQNAVEYIRNFQIDLWQNLQLDLNHRTRLKEAFATTANGSLAQFWQLRPTFENVMMLIRQNGGLTGHLKTLTLSLKRGAFENDLVLNSTQFSELMGPIFPLLGDHSNYITENTDLLIHALFQFAENENRTISDLRRLIPFVRQVPLDDDVALQRAEWLNQLDQLIQGKVAEIPQRIVNRLRARVLDLYEQIRPNHYESPIKFYLLRPQTEWPMPQVQVKTLPNQEHFNCPICLSEFEPNEEYVTHPLHLDFLAHLSCAYSSIGLKVQIEEGHFPLRWSVGWPAGSPHAERDELPLTAEFLLNLRAENPRTHQVENAFTAEEVHHWEIQTLLAYYRKLTENQNPNPLPAYRHCQNQDHCRNFIFRDELPQNHQYQCNACGDRYCYDCVGIAHPGLTCEEAQQEQGADYHDPNSNLRPCPYCLTPAAKDNACNHVRCANPVCRREWHFVHGKPRQGSFTHTFNPFDQNGAEVVPPRTYRVRGDVGYVQGLEMESGFPAGDGLVVE